MQVQNSLVADWFGDEFSKLDPLLQELHRYGGNLSGLVNLEYSSGVSGFLGRRLAPKLGLPIVSGEVDFEVNISHVNNLLVWDRQFASKHKMTSTFAPHGHYPDGHWSETTGKLAVELGVVIHNGGWYWVQKKINFMGIQLPLWLFPAARAYKCINNGLYEFSVTFTLPLLGTLISYKGALTPKLK